MGLTYSLRILLRLWQAMATKRDGLRMWWSKFDQVSVASASSLLILPQRHQDETEQSLVQVVQLCECMGKSVTKVVDDYVAQSPVDEFRHVPLGFEEYRTIPQSCFPQIPSSLRKLHLRGFTFGFKSGRHTHAHAHPLPTTTAIFSRHHHHRMPNFLLIRRGRKKKFTAVEAFPGKSMKKERNKERKTHRCFQ
jgi:hypothetical protein